MATNLLGKSKMQHQASHDEQSMAGSTRMGDYDKPKPAQRDAKQEAAHVHQIVTTRGEGLSDLLFMKREFERHISKVSFNELFVTVFLCELVWQIDASSR